MSWAMGQAGRGAPPIAVMPRYGGVLFGSQVASILEQIISLAQTLGPLESRGVAARLFRR